MSRRPRDLDAERAALHAAADRLLAGIPLRSTSGRLTVTELIGEAAMRRDAVYASHKPFLEEFAARIKAQSFTPDTMRDLAAQNELLKEKLAKTAELLLHERQQTAVLRRSVAELSIEVDLARTQMEAASKVTHLPRVAGRSRTS